RGYPGIALGDSGGASPSPTPNKSKSVPLEAAHHNYSLFIFHSSLLWRYLMSYQEEYRQKLTTAEEAVKVVKSGDWVDYGWCTNTAEVLDQALAGRMGELHDVKVRGGILLHMPAIAQIENPAEHFTWNSWHMSGVERKLVKMGLAYYAPI